MSAISFYFLSFVLFGLIVSLFICLSQDIAYKLPFLHQLREEMWRRREEERLLEEEERWYWEERRRYEEECEYLDWCRRYPRGPPGPPPMMPPGMPRPPFMPGMPPMMVYLYGSIVFHIKVLLDN